MPVYGRVIVIRRNGSDGSQFPITNETCVFGRSHDCDIRVQLPYVSNEQCKLTMNDKGEFTLSNISKSNNTVVNKDVVEEEIKLSNNDVITIVDRSFRFEYPENNLLHNAKTPLGEHQIDQKKKLAGSPFGELVKNMKSMIKSGTPKRRKSITKGKKISLNREPSPQSSKKSLTPKLKVSNGEPAKQDETSHSDVLNAVSVSQRRSISAFSVVKANAERRRSDSVPANLQGKENLLEVQPGRRSSRRLSSTAKKSEEKKRESIASPAGRNSIVKTPVDNRSLSSESLPSANSPVVKKQEKNVKRSSRRSSLLERNNHSISSEMSETPNAKSTESFLDSTTTMPENNEEVNAAVSLSKVSGHESVINSTDTPDLLNEGMITENSLDATGSDNTSIQTSSQNSILNESSALSMSKDQSTLHDHSPDTSSASLESVPKISLTPTSSQEPTGGDPYEFPAEVNNDSTKKYRRRSSGSSNLSHRQTLLLFGSPRVKQVTPLRRSIGRLKQKAESLAEEQEEVASPELPSNNLKRFKPLPETVEIENNSSPIKKPRLPLHSASGQKESNGTPPALGRRKKPHRVSFGPDLSPEQFLRHMPPNTPVKRGSNPNNKGVSTRQSLSASGSSPLPTVKENAAPHAFKSPTQVTRKYKKVDRTPTPFRPDPKKLGSKSLLHQVLQATLPNDVRSDEGASPKLTRKRKSSEKVEVQKDESPARSNEISKASPKSAEKQKIRRRSTGNTPIKCVHKTAVNLRRRSAGKAVKPTWSEVVKQLAESSAPMKAAKQATRPKVSRKKTVRNTTTVTPAKDRHVNSPATIYIGRTRRRVQPTKTPRPSRTTASVKLNIPSNEDLSGLPEMFATPPVLDQNADQDLYDDLMTPKSVGEMLVSPITAKNVSNNGGAISRTSYASPELRKTPLISPDMSGQEADDQSAGKRRRLSPRAIDSNVNQLMNKEDSEAIANSVEDHFGTKRIFKTPKDKDSKSQPVVDHFGTKRLLKTPRDKKEKPVESHFGTKRLLKTPRDEKSQPVESHFGTKRLLKTPRGEKSKPVQEHFGTKRIFNTPRDEKSQPVNEHFGTKRIFNSPKQQKSKVVEEHFGTKRIFTSPKNKKSKAVESRFGLERLFHVEGGKLKKVEDQLQDEDLHLNLLYSTEETVEATEFESSGGAKQRKAVQPEEKRRTTRRNKSAASESSDPLPSRSSRYSKRRAKTSPETSTDINALESQTTKTAEKPKSLSSVTEPLTSAPDDSRTDKEAKRVRFHSSVKPAIVDSDLIEEEEPSTKRRKPNPVKAAANVRTTRRGRNKPTPDEDISNAPEPVVSVKSKTKGKRVGARTTVKESGLAGASGDSSEKSNDVGESIATKSTVRKGRSRKTSKDAELSQGEMKEAKETEVTEPVKPVSKTRRGRAKAPAKEPEIEATDKPEDSVIEKSVTKRGRSKAPAKEAVESKDNTETNETEKPVSNTRRGRGTAKKITVVSEDAVETSSQNSEESAPSNPTTRRGRNEQKTTAKSEVAEPVKPAVGTRRGRAKTPAKESGSISDDVTEQSAEKVVPSISKAGKGRSRKVSKSSVEKKQKTVDETEVSQPLKATSTTRKTKTKTSAKKTVASDDGLKKSEESQEVDSRTSRRRKTSKDPDDDKRKAVVEPVKPVVKTKRGRAKTPAKESGSSDDITEGSVDVTEEVVTSEAGKGRSRKVSKNKESETKAAPSRAAAKKGKKAEVAVEKSIEAEETTAAKKPKRGKALETEPILRRSSRRK